jgi:restriction system protein
MTVPDFQSLMLPVLRVAADGPLAMAEARDRVAKALALTTEDLELLLPSGRQTTFANRVAWAKAFLERAGLLESVRRGVFRATDRGRQVLSESPTRIDIGHLRRFPEFRAWRQDAHEAGVVDGGVPALNGEAGTPEERIEAAHAALAAALRSELLARIVEAPWQLFERLVVDLLVAMGYGGGRAEMARAFTRTGGIAF